MPPPPGTGPLGRATTDAAILYVQSTVKDIKIAVDSLDCNFGNFQINYTRSHEQLSAAVDNTQRITSRHDLEIQDMQKSLQKLTESIAPLIAANKVLTFVSGAVGLSVIALIWGILTHAVTLNLHP